MLALASNLEWSAFPSPLLQAMEGFGLSQRDRKPGQDIRSVQDSEGRTSSVVAKEVGGAWNEWINTGRLEV